MKIIEKEKRLVEREFEKWKQQTLDRLIDDRIELFSLNNTIAYLLEECALTRDQIVDDLSFDADDVDAVIRELDAQDEEDFKL